MFQCITQPRNGLIYYSPDLKNVFPGTAQFNLLAKLNSCFCVCQFQDIHTSNNHNSKQLIACHLQLSSYFYFPFIIVACYTKESTFPHMMLVAKLLIESHLTAKMGRESLLSHHSLLCNPFPFTTSHRRGAALLTSYLIGIAHVSEINACQNQTNTSLTNLWI